MENIFYGIFGIVARFSLLLLIAYLKGECVWQPFWFKANRRAHKQQP